MNDVWSVIRLEDGTEIRIRVVTSEVYRLPGVDALTGHHLYLVKTTNVIAIDPPRGIPEPTH